MTKREQRHKRNLQIMMIRTFRRVLIIPTVLWLLICIFSLIFPGLKKTLDYDLGENRYMASFPDNFSSKWFSELELYYNDHAPFRSILITLNHNMGYVLEQPYDNGIRDSLVAMFHKTETDDYETTPVETTLDYNALFGTTTAVGESKPVATKPGDSINIDISIDQTAEPSGDIDVTTEVVESTTEERVYPVAPTEAVDTGYYAPVVSNNYTLLGRSNWLFLAGNNIEYYQGNNLATEAQMQTYADTLNRLKAICDSKGKKLAILMVPCKPQIYPEYMPTYEVYNTTKRVETLVNYISDHTDVPISYPIDELKAMKNFFLTYKKYDGHWNAAGAFTGYQMVLKMLGMPTTNALDLNVEMYPVGTGGGDLINPGALNAANYMNDYDYNFHYKDYIGITGTEGEVFRNDIYYRAFSTADNPEKVAVIGDSFRNHMVLYMCKDFQDSSLIHFDQLGDSNVDSIIYDADVIVYMLVERNDRKLISISEHLIELLSR